MMSSALALAFLFPYPLPYPLFSTNPENPSRVAPTPTIAHEEEIQRKKEEQKENKSKMSIFASQPLSMFGASSHYITTRKQVKTPSYKSKPDSAISLPGSTTSGSASMRSGSTSIASELLSKPQPIHSVRPSRSRSSSISFTPHQPSPSRNRNLCLATKEEPTAVLHRLCLFFSFNTSGREEESNLEDSMDSFRGCS
jgi:hypothetical protein